LVGKLIRFFPNIDLRWVQLAFTISNFILFILICSHLIRKTRLNPLWISVALLLFAFNPTVVLQLLHLNYTPFFLFLLLFGTYAYLKQFYFLQAVCLSLAVATDFRALILVVAFIVSKALESDQSKVLFIDRILSFIAPFFIAIGLIIFWQGVVPQGEPTQWLQSYRERTPFIRLDYLFYWLCLLPLYFPWFSWVLGFKARSRALLQGVIVTALFIPLYFLFPMSEPFFVRSVEQQQYFGFIDMFIQRISGEYRNLILFVPYLAGVFLFLQLLLAEILEVSRWIWIFILGLFVIQPFMISSLESHFIIVLPFFLFFALSEGLVGERGNYL
jgi:hypothetical protein